MTPRIIICTADDASWDSIRHALSKGTPLRLERVERLEDAAKHGATDHVALAVVDDRFLPVLIEVEIALRRFSSLFRDTVIMTIGELLTAQWIGLLGRGLPSEPLINWMARDRTTPRPTAAWQ